MKKNLIYFLVLLLFPAVLAACSEDDLSSTSVIQPPQVVQNDFDRWLDRHYLAPYNIEFQYRYTDIESSMGYYLTPADYNQSIALAKLVIALCLEPYDEVTGSRDFIRAYFPKIIFLTGSPAYKSNGSIILGTAEGGKKITLFNVDALQIATIDASTNYFKTISGTSSTRPSPIPPTSRRSPERSMWAIPAGIPTRRMPRHSRSG
jgi:substrate import-associated zinc metallohydrolase lipoprotein